MNDKNFEEWSESPQKEDQMIEDGIAFYCYRTPYSHRSTKPPEPNSIDWYVKTPEFLPEWYWNLPAVPHNKILNRSQVCFFHHIFIKDGKAVSRQERSPDEYEHLPIWSAEEAQQYYNDKRILRYTRTWLDHYKMTRIGYDEYGDRRGAIVARADDPYYPSGGVPVSNSVEGREEEMPEQSQSNNSMPVFVIPNQDTPEVTQADAPTIIIPTPIPPDESETDKSPEINLTINGVPLEDELGEMIKFAQEEGFFNLELFNSRKAMIEAVDKPPPNHLITYLLDPGSGWDDEKWGNMMRDFCPKTPPIPDLSDFQYSVHLNPEPDRSERRDPVLYIVEHWIQWYDKYDNPVNAWDRYSERGQWNWIVDGLQSAVQMEWEYTTDSGHVEILQQYEIGYSGPRSTGTSFYIPAEPGNLRMRLIDYAVGPYDPVNVCSEWSEPHRITHGFQYDDDPFAPDAIMTEPYIPIEKMVK